MTLAYAATPSEVETSEVMAKLRDYYDAYGRFAVANPASGHRLLHRAALTYCQLSALDLVRYQHFAGTEDPETLRLYRCTARTFLWVAHTLTDPRLIPAALPVTAEFRPGQEIGLACKSPVGGLVWVELGRGVGSGLEWLFDLADL